MKLSVSTYSLSRTQPHWSVAKKIDWIADAGVQGIEFSGIADEKATTVAKRCEKRGIPVSSYCIGANLLCSPKAQKAEIARVKEHVDIAAALGAPSMRHDIARGFETYKGYRGPKTFSTALKIVVPAIREIADYAAEKGVITTLENHGFYMQAPQRVKKLIDTVNHDNFSLTIDMGNFLCVNADPVEAVRMLAKYAVMAHTKDFHIRPKKSVPPTGWFATPTPIALRGAIVGHGAIDIPKQLRILKSAGYKGYLSLEFEGMEDPPTAVALGLDYLRRELTAIKALG